MTDKTLKRELKKLLSEVDFAREQEQQATRGKAIAERKLVQRYGTLMDALVLPALRQLMFELERRGHLGRLERRSESALRLDVQVAGRKAVQATIDAQMLYTAEPRLRFVVQHEFRVLHTAEAPLETLTEATLAPLVVNCLRSVTSLAS